MKKAIMLTLFVMVFGIQSVSAAKLSSLSPQNIDGPVTKNDTTLFEEYYKTVKIPENNDDKKMSWTLAPFIHSLLFMYELTNDIQYLDYAMVCADQIILAKRKNDIDYPTQKNIPGWGYLNDEFKNANGPVLYNNVVGNATITRALSRLALIIEKNKLAPEYRKKAKQYVYSSIETINYFLSEPLWFNSKKSLFHYPKNKRHERVLKGLGGLTLAHNRQLLIASSMLYVTQYYEASSNKFPYQKEYTSIIDSVANFFWAKAKAKKKKGVLSYSWYYRERGKKGKSPKIEDIGHGGYDVKALVHIYQARKIGSDEKMKALASTLIDNAMIDKLNHEFAYTVDGKKSKGKNSSLKIRRDSMRWLALSNWDKRVYDNAGWLLTNNVKLSNALPYAEFLYYKAKFYGLE